MTRLRTLWRAIVNWWKHPPASPYDDLPRARSERESEGGESYKYPDTFWSMKCPSGDHRIGTDPDCPECEEHNLEMATW